MIEPFLATEAGAYGLSEAAKPSAQRLSSWAGAIIPSKVGKPRPPLNLMHRPYLVDRLERGLSRRVTIVRAPAGYGKSALLADWAATFPLRGESVAWLLLDAEENDPVRLARYLLASLATLLPDQREASHCTPRPSGTDLDTLVAAVTDLMGAIPFPFWLVLDDYHLLQAAAVHSFMEMLVTHMPGQAHLVALTRCKPALPIARLRSRGELSEVLLSELTFSADEVQAYLQQSLVEPIPEATLRRLTERTEGWAAGLQLAVQAIAARPEILQVPSLFTDGHRYVSEYVTEVALHNLPEAAQHFLLHTAILDRFDAAICNGMTARSDGQSMLQLLEANGLFLLPLDEEGRWYRYHHLFADVIRRRLRALHPELAADLHRRASLLYEQMGATSDALVHASATGDRERVANLMERLFAHLRPPGEVNTLSDWLQVVPKSILERTSPHQLVNYCALVAQGTANAVALSALGDPLAGAIPQAEMRINHHFAHVQGIFLAMRAHVLQRSGDLAGALEHTVEALARISDADLVSRGVISIALGEIAERCLTPEARDAFYFEAITCRSTDTDVYELLRVLRLIVALHECGLVTPNVQLVEQVTAMIAERSAEPLRLTAWAHIAKGFWLYERHELRLAATELTQVIASGTHGGLSEVEACGFALLCRVYHALGDREEAMAMFEGARQALPEANRSSPTLVDALHPLLSGYAADRTTRQAWRWTGDPGSTPRRFSATVPARALRAQGHLVEASQFLTSLAERARAEGQLFVVAEAQALQSLLLRELGQAEQAVDLLRQALRVAMPFGYRQLFLDEGPEMELLLQQLQHLPLPVDEEAQIEQLVEAFQRARSQNHREMPPAPCPVALTSREGEILTLLSQGLSNQAICQCTGLALNTVKRHVSNILAKLDATSRSQAIVRARQFRLVEESVRT